MSEFPGYVEMDKRIQQLESQLASLTEENERRKDELIECLAEQAAGEAQLTSERARAEHAEKMLRAGEADMLRYDLLLDEKQEAEQRAARYEEAVRVYTSKLHLCSTRPCSCGAYTSLLEALEPFAPPPQEETE
jgi:regulator of replication initiation timing